MDPCRRPPAGSSAERGAELVDRLRDAAEPAAALEEELAAAVADAGILDVLYGTDAAGLGGGGSEQLTQQDAAGTVEAGDRFGEALSEPFFFLNDVLEDVAVGAPGEIGRAHV